MKKEQLDELYHLLRVATNTGYAQQSTEITDAICGLAGHLLAGRDYLRLIQYSRYYGEKYLLDPTYEAIRARGWQPKRFVDLGAGLGWLGRGLAVRFKIAEVLTIDKRPWVTIDVVADLELGSGLRIVNEQLKEGDILVMSDLLHCVENPEGILKAFAGYSMAILEYMPADKAYAASYRKQIKRYGGNPLQAGELIVEILSRLGRKTDVIDLDPYVLILIDKEE